MNKSKMSLLFRWRWTPNGLERGESMNSGRHLLQATHRTSVCSVTSKQLMPTSLRNILWNTQWKICIHAHTALIVQPGRDWWENMFTYIQEKNHILVHIALTGHLIGITWLIIFEDTLEKSLLHAHSAHTKLHKSPTWMFICQRNILELNHYRHHLFLSSDFMKFVLVP